MGDSKSGPLTIADLQAIWASAVDSSYSNAFIAAGDGNGYEAYNQGFAQYARVSTAVDVTTQACYTLPWSGQTNPPAAGAGFATVILTLTRNVQSQYPIRLAAGQVYFAEQVNDWGINGSTPVITGIQFTPVVDYVFMPGDNGPVQVNCVAQYPGYGYNNPLPGTIQVISQIGAGFNNSGGSVSVVTNTKIVVTLSAANIPDMFIPQHVGQYVLFTGGANQGTIARVTAYFSPAGNMGSAVTLEPLGVVETHTTITTPFSPGETLTIKNGATVVGTGIFVQLTSYATPLSRLAFVLLTGTYAVGDTFTGITSTVVVTVTATPVVPAFVAETGTAAWTILSWSTGLGLTVTNAAQPSGGVYPMLDGLGADKDLPRLASEEDLPYRTRQATIADVVTPNAIKRSLYRNLPGINWCLREVGYPLFPGFFYGDTAQGGTNVPIPDGHGDFYDYDLVTVVGTVTGTFQNGERVVQSQSGILVIGRALTQYTGVNAPYVQGQAGVTGIPTGFRLAGFAGVKPGPIQFVTGLPIIGQSSGASITPTVVGTGLTPSNRWKVYLDYDTFRGYFIVGLPQLDFGDFGFFWGAGNGSFGLQNWWDLPAGGLDFWDGYPAKAPSAYQAAYTNIDKIRLGGVSFTFVPADTPCV